MSKLHGEFYCSDPVLGGSSWSSDGSLFAYTAQMAEIEKNNGSDPADYADFGEGYVRKRDPVLVMVDLALKTARVVATPGLLVGQPSFLPDDSLVAFGVRKDLAKRYGVKFCLNRLNGVYQIFDAGGDEAAKVECLTAEFSNARSPRVVDESVVFLTVEDDTPHFSASKLVQLNVPERSTKLIVDIPSGGGNFVGLFLDIMIREPVWRNYLFCTSSSRTFNRILMINLGSGAINILDDDSPYSWTLLAVSKGGYLVARRANLSSPSTVVLGKLDENGVTTWKPIYGPMKSPGMFTFLNTQKFRASSLHIHASTRNSPRLDATSRRSHFTL